MARLEKVLPTKALLIGDTEHFTNDARFSRALEYRRILQLRIHFKVDFRFK